MASDVGLRLSQPEIGWQRCIGVCPTGSQGIEVYRVVDGQGLRDDRGEGSQAVTKLPVETLHLRLSILEIGDLGITCARFCIGDLEPMRRQRLSLPRALLRSFFPLRLTLALDSKALLARDLAHPSP